MSTQEKNVTRTPGAYVEEGFSIHPVKKNLSVRACEGAVIELPIETRCFLGKAVSKAAQHPLRAIERTWAEQHFGIATLMARVDHVGEHICEVEMRPSGAGVVNAGLPTLGSKIQQTRRTCWKGLEVYVLVSPNRNVLVDDSKAGLDIMRPDVFSLYPSNPRCIIRAESDDTAFHAYAPRSIAPVVTEGDRRYGIGWLWETFDQNTAPWDRAFVVKGPGARSERVFFWDPARGQDRSEFLAKLPDEFLVVQPRFDHDECPFARTVTEDGRIVPYATLHRSFFFFNIHRRLWMHAATCWVACPKPPVHGTPDMIMGPVEFV